MDNRYTTTLEHCGHAKPRWVARFCDEWIGSGALKVDALMLCLAHSDRRDRELSNTEEDTSP